MPDCILFLLISIGALSLFHPEIDLLARLGILIPVSLICLFIGYGVHKRWIHSSIIEWVQRSRFHPGACLYALLLSLLTLVLVEFQSMPSARVTLSDSIHKESHILQASHFDLSPALYPDETLTRYDSRLELQAYIELRDSVYELLFYSSRGDCRWYVNGELLAELPETESNRYLLIPVSLLAGVHSIRFECNRGSPPPRMIVSAKNEMNGEFKPLSITSFERSWFSSGLWKPGVTALSILGFLFAFLLAMPSLNYLISEIRFSPESRFVYYFCFALSVLLFSSVLFHAFPDSFHSYEGDEAAFGLMAQRLNQGEGPPLFHYGQEYQGTAEVYLLGPVLSILKPGTESLQFLPYIWLIIFLSTTIYSVYLLFSIYGVLATLTYFLFAGSHFYWISSKTWFGYSLTLAACGSLMAIALHSLNRRSFHPVGGIAWGLITGLSLYALPLSAPAVLLSFVILLYTLRVEWNEGKSIRLSSLSLIFGILVSFGCLSPYWIGDSDIGRGAGEFLIEGRSLPAPRVEGEDPLLDRFIGECLPVLLGARAVYDQQSDIRQVILPDILSVFVLAGILLAPFSLKRAILLTRHRAFISWIVFIYSILTIAMVAYSPFGVWPWYGIALYWSVPLCLYGLFWMLYSICPALTLGALFVFMVSLVTAGGFESLRLYNPSSLSNDGVLVRSDFSPIIDTLNQERISHVLSDQGYDISPDYAGRDWIGECLSFASGGSISSFDRLSRRLPSAAFETMKADRVAYLFHKAFYYNNPTLESNERYVPLTSDAIGQLFGPDGLNYSLSEYQDYRLYTPNENARKMEKPLWKIDSNNPVFLDALHDNNISVRAYGRQTYWSSGYVPENGGWLSIEFPVEKTFSTLLLFHGTKRFDYPRENRVYAIDMNDDRWQIGELTYEMDLRSSVLRLNQPIKAKGLRIEFEAPDDLSWVTIFELWAV